MPQSLMGRVESRAVSNTISEDLALALELADLADSDHPCAATAPTIC